MTSQRDAITNNNYIVPDGMKNLLEGLRLGNHLLWYYSVPLHLWKQTQLSTESSSNSYTHSFLKTKLCKGGLQRRWFFTEFGQLI